MIQDKITLDRKIEQINSLIAEVRAYKDANPDSRCGYYLGYGSLLNAYREGDISFDDAVDLMEKVGGRKSERLRAAVKTAKEILESEI